MRPHRTAMPQHIPDIGTNLERIRTRIQRAALEAGRDPAAIRLIAVSKYMPAAYVEQAIEAGQYIFGENTIQDAGRKLEALTHPGLEWHFIGHLQSNKARSVPGRFHWLHTLDSLKLAHRLSAACENSGSPLQVLLQVNIANDPHKFGLQPEATERFAADLLQLDLPGLQLRGLMTIGRENASPTERRLDFTALRRLRDACADSLGEQYFGELSMGMSDDFELAITEGATMVRIGSSIFGVRPTQPSTWP